MPYLTEYKGKKMSTPESSIKQVTLTGVAAIPTMGGGATRRRVRRQRGGDGGLPLPAPAPAAPEAAATVRIIPTAPAPAPAVPVPAPELVGGFKPFASAAQKIVLRPKKAAVKVLLTRKRPVTTPGTAAKPAHRPARKVTLGLIAHKRRITRARTLRKESRTLPVAQVRATLVEKGIIKPTSKAPDAVLRQMYEDAMALSQPSL
jgi:hypothetical protein